MEQPLEAEHRAAEWMRKTKNGQEDSPFVSRKSSQRINYLIPEGSTSPITMYRVRVQPEVARAMFLTYVTYLNNLKNHPEWYNELTRNCTTTLEKQLAADANNPQPWNYQFILNGTLDELLYNRGRLVTGGLPLPELKQREHINPAAQAAGQSPDFSALIRAGRIGF